MSKSPLTFRQSDVTRAIKAVRKAGERAKRVEIDTVTGNIVVLLAAEDEVKPERDRNDWDEIHGQDAA